MPDDRCSMNMFNNGSKLIVVDNVRIAMLDS